MNCPIDKRQKQNHRFFIDNTFIPVNEKNNNQ